jgi:spore coat protein U domain-containing protein, fimbrial subunit CupE1/2/3/6
VKRLRSVLPFLLLLPLFLGGEARAACNVSATSVSFGAYDVFSPTPLDSTGSVTVSCDEVPPADVTIEIGPSAGSGGFNPRQMRHSSRPDRLGYNLFTDPSRSATWGDGTAGTQTVVLKNVHRQKPPVVTTIYGRIPPGQNVSVGVYTDTLTVTITW